MAKYLSNFREPIGFFKVKSNSKIFTRYTSAKHYLNNYNTDINKIIYDLNELDNHIGKLRGYLSTPDSSHLNREGYLLMQTLENFIIKWKNSNLTYYKALIDVLSERRKADDTFNKSSILASNEIKNSRTQ